MTARASITRADAPIAGDHLLAVRGLQKYFPIKEGAMQRVAGQVKAVDGISLEVRRGEGTFRKD